MRKRFRADLNKNPSDSYDFGSSLDKMNKRLSVFGGEDQWTRMRQDKLRSLKKALLASYQRAIVQKYDVKKALLKARSPSCGNGKVYDGTFTDTLIDDDGVTTKLLKENGIEIITIK